MVSERCRRRALDAARTARQAYAAEASPSTKVLTAGDGRAAEAGQQCVKSRSTCKAVSATTSRTRPRYVLSGGTRSDSSSTSARASRTLARLGEAVLLTHRRDPGDRRIPQRSQGYAAD